jgi:hypothetical protein
MAPLSEFLPHIMVFYPQMQNADYGLVESDDNRVPAMLEPDTPMSALIVVMHDWVDTVTAMQ